MIDHISTIPISALRALLAAAPSRSSRQCASVSATLRGIPFMRYYLANRRNAARQLASALLRRELHGGRGLRPGKRMGAAPPPARASPTANGAAVGTSCIRPLEVVRPFCHWVCPRRWARLCAGGERRRRRWTQRQGQGCAAAPVMVLQPGSRMTGLTPRTVVDRD
jgi:hypothetical protein